MKVIAGEIAPKPNVRTREKYHKSVELWCSGSRTEGGQGAGGVYVQDAHREDD